MTICFPFSSVHQANKSGFWVQKGIFTRSLSVDVLNSPMWPLAFLLEKLDHEQISLNLSIGLPPTRAYGVSKSWNVLYRKFCHKASSKRFLEAIAKSQLFVLTVEMIFTFRRSWLVPSPQRPNGPTVPRPFSYSKVLLRHILA